jgi:hypothetical protein
MTYASPTWDYAEGALLMKLQHLQNRVLCPIGNLKRGTAARELHVAFKISYVYDCVTKLCRTQAEVILKNVNSNVRGIGEARHLKFKRFKLGGDQAYDLSAD